MLDQKVVFDDMVAKHAPNQKTRDKILAHPLYETASLKVASALEYMALAKLQEMVSCQRYDFVVIDTPPDTNAIDFLVKPNVLARFITQYIFFKLEFSVQL